MSTCVHHQQLIRFCFLKKKNNKTLPAQSAAFAGMARNNPFPERKLTKNGVRHSRGLGEFAHVLFASPDDRGGLLQLNFGVQYLSIIVVLPMALSRRTQERPHQDDVDGDSIHQHQIFLPQLAPRSPFIVNIALDSIILSAYSSQI